MAFFTFFSWFLFSDIILCICELTLLNKTAMELFMREVGFQCDFPQNQEDLKDFPSHVVWKNEDEESLTMVKVAADSWFFQAKEDKETVVLSCKISRVPVLDENEQVIDTTWEASEITHDSSVNNFNEAWEFLNSHALYMPVTLSNGHDRPDVEKAEKMKIRFK